ncbi:hypothetical protein [Kibdelosporangium phytohabitans]|uniref:Uncharacterized protein n=1 Tax=Kibdelosporangium phytohabitans TaxID=860235 RepID=A0A0N9HPX6_9PSEU|nr:hypothetical protein [Kibdelosporangium phytohabitans]ALG06709.1 hypothetical protein AOZ06_07000 [Kibdelosporangium phytohabitans]MBE1467930.1 hypothetical protein [Kibdelosporangium phytohabitans]
MELSTSQASVSEQVKSLLAAGTPVINLVGPIGVGKSTVLAALADDPDLSRTVTFLDDPVDVGPHDTPVVAASRKPVRGVVVEVPRWTTPEVTRLATGLGVDDELVTLLSGGLPLVVRSLCRALREIPSTVPGAVADRALREMRLEPGFAGALAELAVVGRADEELLTELVEVPRDHDWFGELAGSCLVTATVAGLAVIEPFRTLLDLRHRWRKPVAHRTAITKATVRNRRLLAAATDDDVRQALTEHSLFLTDDPLVRRTLFPASNQDPLVRKASTDEYDEIAVFLREWARQGGLNPARTDRMLDDWLTHAADGFNLVCGPDNRPVGMSFTPKITDEAMAVIEPITQQHTDSVVDGAFIGMAVCDPRQPAAHAALLRHVLAVGVQYGGLVIATPSPQYQALSQRFGFNHPGAARHDPYDCGRDSEIFTQDFVTWDRVTGWLDQLAAVGVAPPVPTDVRWCAAEIRKALEHVNDSAKLARSPLVVVTGTADVLHTFLTNAITELASAQDQTTSQAGHILHAYYLRRRRDHVGVANQLHLSRATYFRRLDHGLVALATRLLSRWT